MLKIIKNKEAEADLEEIWDFIAMDSPEIACRFLRALNEHISNLTQNPKIGRERGDLAVGLRSVPFGSYVIFYRPQKDSIEIARVLHGSRDIESFF